MIGVPAATDLVHSLERGELECFGPRSQTPPTMSEGPRSPRETSRSIERENGSEDIAYSTFATDPGRPLLLAFGGINLGFGMPPFEFQAIANRLDCNFIFVRDPSQSWYQGDLPGLGAGVRDLVHGLESVTRNLQPSRLACTGNCTGGYAALLAGSHLGADSVLAFAPATYFSFWLRLRMLDWRWRDLATRSRRAAAAHPPSFDLKRYLRSPGWRSAVIYFDGSHRLDSVHARRLAALPRTRLISSSGGHGVVQRLREEGRLEELLRRAVFGHDP